MYLERNLETRNQLGAVGQHSQTSVSDVLSVEEDSANTGEDCVNENEQRWKKKKIPWIKLHQLRGESFGDSIFDGVDKPPVETEGCFLVRQ